VIELTVGGGGNRVEDHAAVPLPLLPLQRHHRQVPPLGPGEMPVEGLPQRPDQAVGQGSQADNQARDCTGWGPWQEDELAAMIETHRSTARLSQSSAASGRRYTWKEPARPRLSASNSSSSWQSSGEAPLLATDRGGSSLGTSWSGTPRPRQLLRRASNRGKRSRITLSPPPDSKSGSSGLVARGVKCSESTAVSCWRVRSNAAVE
jgi:hypothetical protein